MEIRPGQNFSVVRQLEDPADTGTYYVRARIRDAITDELIATLSLTSAGDQRYTNVWNAVADPSGLGRYIDIETMVFTDAGFTTVSDVYRRENAVYLLQDRVDVHAGTGGMDVDYERIEKIVDGKVVVEKKKKVPKTDLTPVLEGIDQLKTMIAEIDIPEQEPVDFSGVLTKLENAQASIEKAIAEKDVTEATDIAPIMEKLDSMKIDDYQKEASELIKAGREVVGKDLQTILLNIKAIKAYLDSIPFIVMHGEKGKMEEPKVEAPKPRQRMVGNRGFISGVILWCVAVTFVAAGVIGVFTRGMESLPDEPEQPVAVESENLGDTVGSLQLWVSTTTPTPALTQRTMNKAVRITGLNSCDTIDTDSNGYLACGSDASGGGGGGGSIGTSTTPVVGELAFWNSLSTIGSVATGTLTETALGLEFNATRGLVGGAAVLSYTSGYQGLTIASGTAYDSFYNAPSSRITAGTGIDWSGNTLNGVYTAGDAITLTGEDFDFDGGTAPAGALGGTWASPTVDNDGHSHTGTTLSAIDLSDDVNLTAGDALTLTGDDIDFDGGTSPSGELGGTWGSITIDDSIAVTGWNLTTPTLTSFFGTPCTGNNFLQDISDTGAFTCAGASGGGGGSGNWSTTTDNNAEIAEIVNYTNDDTYIGGSASNTAEFNFDVESSTFTMSSTSSAGGYIGIGTTSRRSALNVEGSVFFTGNATATNIHATGTLTVGTLTGLLKGTTGVVSVATPGTDYLTTAITSLGGQTGATQTFATTSNAGGFGFSSGSNTHTLNLPQAGASTVLGLLSASDYATFAAKADLSSAMTGTFDGNNFAGGAIATGDILYGASAGSITELGIGTAGQILVVSGGIPAWVSTTTIPLGGDVTGTLSATVVGNDSHDHTSATLSGIDISADTNLTAGDALTLTDDDIDFDGGASPGGSLGGTWASPTIDDLFLLNNGDVGTGNYDFGGATFFEIPNGTGATADDPGEITHDTSDNQLVMDDFVFATGVQKIWSTTVSSTSPAFVAGGLLKVPTHLDGYTVTAIRCSVQSGTNKVIAVEDESGNSSEDITCTTSVTSDDGSITNATYTAAEESYIDFGATSGAVDYVSISVFGTWTRE